MRTKWRSVARDERNTVAPDLAGMSLGQWMRGLEALGVNLAEINLDPINKLATDPALPDAELQRSAAALYTPLTERRPEEAVAIANIEREIVPNRRYTAAQRNALQLDFLRRLEKLRRAGRIAGSVRFLIHQRLWFRPVCNSKMARQWRSRIGQFAEDIGSFVRLAEADGLGHWLAGIRLGEHSNNDMNQLLPLLVALARRVNGRSNGWLRHRLFLANGGGWGAEYRGFGRVTGADGAPYRFFPQIAAETGGFAFAYKWMQFHDEIGEDIGAHMAAAGFAPNSIADWETYLSDVLGFAELIDQIAANRLSFPAHAAVVFAGDASDAATGMVRVGPAGRLEELPPLTALRRLFAKGGAGFRGRVFMNGYSTAATLRDYRRGDPVDIGRALYFADASGRARMLPWSQRLWETWAEM